MTKYFKINVEMQREEYQKLVDEGYSDTEIQAHLFWFVEEATTQQQPNAQTKFEKYLEKQKL